MRPEFYFSHSIRPRYNLAMPPRRKINREKVMASLATICTVCGYRIEPAEIRRIDSERMLCPKCGKAFEPAGKTRDRDSINLDFE